MTSFKRSVVFVALLTSFIWVGCGDDNPTSNNNSWKTKQDMSDSDLTSSDMSSNDMGDMPTSDMSGDMTNTEDMAGADMSGDMQNKEDMTTTEDMAKDMPGEDMDNPDMVITDPFLASMTRAPFVGIFELESQGAQAIGVAVELAFAADYTVEFRQNGVRKGKWQKLNDGKVYVFDLPTEDGASTETLTFESVINNQRVTALQLALGQGRKFTLEPVNANTPDYTKAELQGRWQSLRKHTNDQGNVYHIALRIDGQQRLEYGVVGRDNVFRSIFQDNVSTMTFFDKRSFWYIVPPTTSVDVQPVGGQLLRDATGDVRLFAPVGEKDAQGMDVFYTYELRKVNQFMFRPGN